MSFYTAAVGAQQQQMRLDIQSNNIANVNNYGFKAEKPSFESLMHDRVNGIDNVQLPRGAGTRVVMAGTDFSDGALADTGRAQDYAIIGGGLFALVDPSNNEISYTRDGTFVFAGLLQQATERDAAGAEAPLVDDAGEPVMETNYYLSDGDGRFVLDPRGQLIEVSDPDRAYDVGVFDFINRDGMLHVGGNRFVPVEKNGRVRVGSGTVRQGVVEASNTDLAYELAKVIEAQRSYSYALRMVQTSDEVENTINGLRG